MFKRQSNCPGSPLVGRSSRREFLYVGLLGGLGLSLPDFLRAEAVAGTGKAAANSVIHIFLPGGIAHQESFDPKPLASPDYRGPFGAINTNVPGIQLSENFPRLAKVMDRATIIRSMTHGEAAHERGTHNMFTGYRPSPAIKYPSLGSIVSHEYGPRNNLPPYICIPNVPNEYAGTGYLSNAYGPFGLGGDPANGNFQVRDLAMSEGVTEGRFNRRRSLLDAVDSHFKSLESADAITAMDSFYERAYNLISSQQAREAFNMKAEPDKVKDAYGRNTAGQRFLLARRLVEAGARFVSVTYGGWDHHNNVRDGINGQVPALDVALSELIIDLEQRGLLDTTLVMVTTEFGRTPKINSTGGRDHWPRVFSTFLAGGGIKRGFVHGSSDALGGEPDLDPVSPESLAATVYAQLGINHEKRLMAPGDRPIDIIRGGSPIKEIIA